jgi:hypothetical protein
MQTKSTFNEFYLNELVFTYDQFHAEWFKLKSIAQNKVNQSSYFHEYRHSGKLHIYIYIYTYSSSLFCLYSLNK